MASNPFDDPESFLSKLYEQFQKATRGFGDPKLDNAWSDMDAWLHEHPAGGYGSDLDEMDRRMRDLGFEPKGGTGFDSAGTKAKAGKSNYDFHSGARAGSSWHDTDDRNNSQRSRTENFSGDVSQLARDYRNLGVEPGASREDIRAAWKTKIKAYHPDRFAQDPKKQDDATRIAAGLNESYQRIISAL